MIKTSLAKLILVITYLRVWGKLYIRALNIASLIFILESDEHVFLWRRGLQTLISYLGMSCLSNTKIILLYDKRLSKSNQIFEHWNPGFCRSVFFIILMVLLRSMLLVSIKIYWLLHQNGKQFHLIHKLILSFTFCFAPSICFSYSRPLFIQTSYMYIVYPLTQAWLSYQQ